MNSFMIYSLAMNFVGLAIKAFVMGFMAYAGIKLASKLFGPIRIDLGSKGAPDA